MIVEGGSQNASRMAGMYAYPAPRYEAGGIEAISAIRGRATPPGTPPPTARLEAQERVNRTNQREIDNDRASLNLYQDPGAPRSNAAAAVMTGGHLDLMA